MTHSALGLNLFGLYGFFRQYNNSARVGRSLRHFPSHSVHCVGRLTTTLDSSRGRRVWKNAACKIRFGHQFVASCQHHNERTHHTAAPPRLADRIDDDSTQDIKSRTSTYPIPVSSLTSMKSLRILTLYRRPQKPDFIMSNHVLYFVWYPNYLYF